MNAALLQTEGTTVEEQLSELSGKLVSLIFEDGIELTKVTQKFNDIKRVFLLRTLSMEFEAGLILLDDYDGILLDNLQTAMSAIIRDNVIDVKLKDEKNENFVGEIIFNNGRLLIEKVEQ